MTKLSDQYREDHEEDPVIAVFLLIMAFVAVWFIASVKFDRSFHILEATCGIGLLVVVFGVYALLSVRRRQQRERNGRCLAQDAPHLAVVFDDEASIIDRVDHQSNNARSV